MNNEIVYLEHARVHRKYKQTVDGVSAPDGFEVKPEPTKCYVTINNEYVIRDVYVAHSNTGQVFLFKEYDVIDDGNWLNKLFVTGRKLVLEFKSENYTIERIV